MTQNVYGKSWWDVRVDAVEKRTQFEINQEDDQIVAKKLFLLLTLLALTALLSYKLGSAPTALARSLQAQEEVSAAPHPLAAPPAQWVLTDHEFGKAASVTKAGAPGVQHVADCITATALTVGATQEGGLSFLELTEGLTVKMQWVVSEPYFSNGMGQVTICGLNFVGAAGSSMTLKFDGYDAGADITQQTINLVGHDAS